MADKIEKVGNLLKVNDKYYVADYEGEDKETGAIVWKPVNKKRYDFLINNISKELINAVDKEMVLKNALEHCDMESLEKLYKKLQKPRKPKTTCQRGCVELMVGGKSLLLAD